MKINSVSHRIVNPSLSRKADPSSISQTLRAYVLPKPEAASMPVKITRLKKELSEWFKKGAKITPKAVRRQRMAICSKCPYYKAGGNFGLGECMAPGCGCSRAKLALATSKCPLNPPKWGAVNDSP